ncbi:hypothetical protein ACWF94_10710 [Streptomyces sp. NPDC055078]
MNNPQRMRNTRKRNIRRGLGSAAAVLGLAAGSLLISTPAQAVTPCDTFYNNTAARGYMYAWDATFCNGSPLGGSAGNDPDWGDAAGPFRGSDANRASSVMNKGYAGNLDVVAFYDSTNYNHNLGYGCLSVGEKYADDLRDNRFTNGLSANNSIRSHRWVNSNGCAAGSWLT